MPDLPTDRRQVLAPLGLVAGMVDELGLGDGLDHATPPHPAMRDLTLGEAVQVRVLNGLGGIPEALDLGPRWVQPHAPSRRISPRVPPEQLNDEALGRAFDTLDDEGVTDSPVFSRRRPR